MIANTIAAVAPLCGSSLSMNPLSAGAAGAEPATVDDSADVAVASTCMLYWLRILTPSVIAVAIATHTGATPTTNHPQRKTLFHGTALMVTGGGMCGIPAIMGGCAPG